MKSCNGMCKFVLLPCDICINLDVAGIASPGLLAYVSDFYVCLSVRLLFP